MEAPGVVAPVPPNRFARRIPAKVHLAIIHATRGKGTQATQARSTINWFSDGRAFPDGSSHGAWGSSAAAVVADNGNITRFHSGSPLEWRSTWAAGYGGLGPRFEWGADVVGVSLEHAQSVHLEDYTDDQYRGSARYWAWVRALQREAGDKPIPLFRIKGWDQKKGKPIPRGFLGHEDLKNGVKLGKALRNDTPIPTPAGWAHMDALAVGDQVFSEEGLPIRVTGVYPQGVTDCWDVQFTSGDSIFASGDHLWTVLDAVESSRRTRTDIMREIEGFEGWADAQPRTTLELMDRLYRGAVHNWSIPLAGPLELPEADLPVDPYMLGVWLGDGNHKAARVTFDTKDEPFFGEIARSKGFPWHSHYQGPGNGVTISMSGEMADGARLRHRLKDLGVWGNKHIPALYLRAGYGQRLALLRGLMDTDGSVVAKSSRTAVIGFSNERMARETRELVASLGLKPNDLKRKQTAGKDHFTFVFAASVPVFTLPRKRDNNRLYGPISPQVLQRRITAISRVDDAETTCIRVDNPSGLFLAGEGMIPTHNTDPGPKFDYERLFNAISDLERGASAPEAVPVAPVAAAAAGTDVTMLSSLERRISDLEEWRKHISESVHEVAERQAAVGRLFTGN